MNHYPSEEECKGKVVCNLGSGNDVRGDVRVDLYQTPNTTHVANLDIDKIPVKDNTFDIIYCKSVIEHIKNLDNFEKECFRTLKPNGKLIIITDYAGYLMRYISKKHEHNYILLPFYEKDGYGHEQGEDIHCHLFVESHLRKILKRFKNHKVTYIVGGRNKILHFILRLLPFKLGVGEIKIECRK